MKKLFFIYFLLTFFITFSQRTPQIENNRRNPNSALIEINSAGTPESFYSPQELVENVLFSGCVNLSNFSAVVAGTPSQNTTKSYGYFHRTPGSTFPFESGIVITNGIAYRGGNTTINYTLADDISPTPGPETDHDLATVLAPYNNLNVTQMEAILSDRTVFEFDFVPSQNQISFNFLMASEEYTTTFPCEYADGFAFLLKPVGGTYTNLAIVPNTDIPIAATTVHPANEDNGSLLPCPPINETYFEGYDIGDTNYNGRTKVFTATGQVVAGQTYHIKMIVADSGNTGGSSTDSTYDTAIFLEAGSFNIGAVTIKDSNNNILSNPLDLCQNDPFPELHIDPMGGANYQWYVLNNSTNNFDPIPGATNNQFSPTQDGTYQIVVTLPSGGCQQQNQIQITHHALPVLNTPLEYPVCDNDTDGSYTLNLSDINPNLSSNFNTENFSYFTSLSDAQNNTNPIVNTTAHNLTDQENLWVRVENSFGCISVGEVHIKVAATQLPANYHQNVYACDQDSNPNDGITSFDLSGINNQIINLFSANQQSHLNLTYYTSQNDAVNQTNAISDITDFINSGGQSEIWIRIENDLNPACNFIGNIATLTIDATPLSNNVVIPPMCDDDETGVQIFDTSNLESELLNGQVNNVSITYFESDGVTPLTDYDGQNITSPFPNDFKTDSKTIIARLTSPYAGCQTDVSIDFTIQALPQFQVTSPQSICLNLPPITLEAENPDGNYNYQWTLNGQNLGTNATLEINQAGNYDITAINPVTGCQKTQTIEVIASEIAHVTLDDLIITDAVDNNMVQIIVENLGIGDYQYSLDDGPFQDDAIFEGLSPGEHTLTIEDKNGCGTVSIDFSVIGFPKFVTPNSDGNNDFWNAVGMERQPKSKIYIYDRYGKMIYSFITGDSQGWNGFLKERKLLSTDYWFKAELEDGRTIFGHFALKR